MEKKTKKSEVKSKAKYFYGLGRRKTSVVAVRLFPEGSGGIIINGRELEKYFPTLALQKITQEALSHSGLSKKLEIQAKAHGGGASGQAKAFLLATARALVVMDPALKLVLKKHKLLTRDSRKKERKKPGLKRARRAPQWQKR